MDGPLYVYTTPFRPIPIYGQRACLDIQSCGNPSSQVGEFLRPSPWKLPMERGAFGKIASSYPATSYSLVLQEHMRRQQESCCNRLNEAMTKLTYSPAVTQPNVILTGRPSDGNNASLLNLTVQNSSEKMVSVSSEPSSGTILAPLSDPYAAQYGFGRKVFPCSQCRYTTDRRNNLKRHMLTMHQACSKMLECCGILFTTKASLREHAMIFHYHGYTCFYCGRRFCRKALLKRHLSVHNGQKDFVCTICDYATSHKSNLERHRKVHSRQDDGKDPMSPDSCDPNDFQSHGGTGFRGDDDDGSSEDLSICTDDEDEEINVHTDD